MDRVGMIRDESDRDSSSNRAIAGSSLNGSLCGSQYAGCSGFHNKYVDFLCVLHVPIQKLLRPCLEKCCIGVYLFNDKRHMVG